MTRRIDKDLELFRVPQDVHFATHNLRDSPSLSFSMADEEKILIARFLRANDYTEAGIKPPIKFS